MTPQPSPLLSLLSLLPLLSACAAPDGTLPAVEVHSALPDPLPARLSVTVKAADDSGIASVSLYARAPGSPNQGQLLGSTAEASGEGLYTLSVSTATLPDKASLELYATATDGSGEVGASAPVAVRTDHPGAPALSYLVAYTLPKPPAYGTPCPKPSASASPSPAPAPLRALGTAPAPSPARLVDLDPALLRPPQGSRWSPARAGGERLARPAAAALERDYALEWGWPPVPGADGYALYQSRGELAGPYEAQCRQAAGAAGRQSYSQYVTAAPGEGFYGALTVLTGGATRESALSNADGAVFLPPQEALAPAQGASVSNGRPQLSWARTEGAAGYLYFVLDRDPWDPRARVLWTNPANPDGTVSVTPQLSATYPDSRAPLPSGAYFWWVAGVSFDEKGIVDGLSFSDPRSFTIP